MTVVDGIIIIENYFKVLKYIVLSFDRYTCGYEYMFIL